VPAIDGVAGGRILSIELDGNDAVWLELLVLNAFESEENCIGYVQNQAHKSALNSECHRISDCDFVAFWISAHGLWAYFATSTFPLSRSSGNAIMALTCFGLRLTASGSLDADLVAPGGALTCKKVWHSFENDASAKSSTSRNGSMPTAGLPSLPRGVEGLGEHADQGGLLTSCP